MSFPAWVRAAARPPSRAADFGREWGWLLGVAAAVVAPLAWHLAQGRTLAWFDAATFYAPVRPLIGEALRSFQLPLWNRFVAGGMPLLGEAAHGALHPFSILAAFVARGDGLDPLMVAHVVAAGVGAAVLARALGAGRSASACAGVAFGLSGFTLSMTAHLAYLGGAGALPWCAAGLLSFGRRASSAGLSFGALATAACALTGDPQAALAGVGLGALLAGSIHGARAAGRALAAAALGMAIAAVQLAPLWALLDNSVRAGGPRPEELAAWSLSPWRLVELVSPGFFSWPSEGWMGPVMLALDPGTGSGLPFAASIFVGLPVIAGALTGVRCGREGRTLALAALLLLWLALGPLLGGQQLGSLLPVVRGFRYAEKWVGPLTLCLALLAALGFDRWRAHPSSARRAAWLALGAAAVSVAGLIAAGAVVPAAGARVDANVLAHLTGGLRHAIAAAALLAFAAWGSARLPAAASAALLALLWCEAVAASPFALRPGDAAARLSTPPAETLARAERPRILHAFLDVAPAAGPAFWDEVTVRGAATAAVNHNVRQRIDNLGFYSGLKPARFGAVVETLGLGWPRAARRFGVTHVVTPARAERVGEGVVAHALEGGALVGVEPRTQAGIHAVPHRSWASFAPAVVPVPDLRGALAALAEVAASDDPTVIVEGEGAFANGGGTVLRVARGPASLRVEAEADAAATLVVQEAWWPGWIATVDGQPVAIHPADGLVRAVPFPPGRHVLEMRYRPADVSFGVAVSGLALAALAAASITLTRRARALAQSRSAISP